MLEGLNSVEWARLTHARGEAADVPDLIRALSTNDAKERDDALGTLFDTICHQGSVYEATPFAVPYLIELLAAPGVQGKEEILQLLGCIAEGRSDIDSPSLQERVDRDAELARYLGRVRAALEAIEAGVGTYLDLLSDDEPGVRIFAAYTLSHCRGQAAQVVPFLIARVPSESDARSHAALILALGSLKGKVDEQRQIGRLLAERVGPAEHSVVRLAAAMSIARLRPDEPAPEVLDALTTAIGPAWSDFEGLPWCDRDVPISVGEALAEYPLTRLRFLLGLLDNENEEIREIARFAIDELCGERRSVATSAAAALGERVSVGDLADRRGAVEILSRLGSAAALAAGPLRVALHDDDAQIRARAAVALAGLHDARPIPVLIALLKVLDEDRLFPNIIEALGQFGAAARDAVPALLDVLIRQPLRQPLFAFAHNRPFWIAEALGRIGPEAGPAVPSLIALMRRQPHTHWAVTKALGQIGGNEVRAAIPVLKELLYSQDEMARIHAAQTLWQIDRGAAQVLPVLIQLLSSQDEVARIKAAQMLWKIDHSAAQVLPVLIPLLKPGKNDSLAADALGAMGAAAKEAVPTLRTCLDDRSFHAMWVHLHAARALWRIDRDVHLSLPVLIGLLRDPGNAQVKTQAAETLGEMGAAAQQAVPALRAALEGDFRLAGSIVEDEAFCSAAAEALRRIERV